MPTTDDIAHAALVKLGLRIPSQPRQVNYKRLTQCLLAAIDKPDTNDHSASWNAKYHRRFLVDATPDWQHYKWHSDRAEQYEILVDIGEQIRDGAHWHDIEPDFNAAINRYRPDGISDDSAAQYAGNHTPVFSALRKALYFYRER